MANSPAAESGRSETCQRDKRAHEHDQHSDPATRRRRRARRGRSHPGHLERRRDRLQRTHRRRRGNHYFPPDSVDRAHLESSEKTTVCAWKGRAGYYDIVVGEHRNRAAAWYYPDPSRAAEKIGDHVAFGHGVELHRAAQS